MTWVRSPGVWRIVAAYDPQLDSAALSDLNGEDRAFKKNLCVD